MVLKSTYDNFLIWPFEDKKRKQKITKDFFVDSHKYSPLGFEMESNACNLQTLKGKRKSHFICSLV